MKYVSSTANKQLKKNPKLTSIKFVQPPISGTVKSSSDSVIAPSVQGIPEELKLSAEPIELELAFDQFLTRAAEDIDLYGDKCGRTNDDLSIKDLVLDQLRSMID